MKQKTWLLGEVWSCEAFPFPCPTEMVIRKYGVHYWTTAGKLKEIMRLWNYFAVQKSSFLRLVRRHLTSLKLYRVAQIYFIEGFIL